MYGDPRWPLSPQRFTPLPGKLPFAPIHQNGIRVTVNISPQHLLDRRFVSDIEAALQRYPQFPPKQLELEITETAPLRNLALAHEQLGACNALGVSNC